jgi:ribonucleoside-diphosphate reductase alpha chain
MSAVKQVIAINETDAARLDGAQTEPAPEVASSGSEAVRAVRRRLPDERRAITHHFSIAGQEGYLTVGVYEDGSPGELCQEDEKSSCCTKDEGGSFGVAL